VDLCWYSVILVRVVLDENAQLFILLGPEFSRSTIAVLTAIARLIKVRKEQIYIGERKKHQVQCVCHALHVATHG